MFTLFFEKASTPQARKAFHSLTFVVVMLAVAFFISHLITDFWWSNRIQHALGGGATVFFLCWRIVGDAELRISKMQTFIFCFLIVTALGVGNELVEYVMQHWSVFVFAQTVDDTWLDLWSNAIGALISGVFLVTVLKQRS